MVRGDSVGGSKLIEQTLHNHPKMSLCLEIIDVLVVSKTIFRWSSIFFTLLDLNFVDNIAKVQNRG